MKETVKTFVIVVLFLLVVLLSVKSMKCYQEAQEKPETKTITVTDTLTNIVYDTVYLERYKTVKLPVVDSTVYFITDTVVRLDSIEVEVPISKYSVDTTFVTDSTVFNLSIRNSGYAVTLDTIFYNFKYTPRPSKTNFFRDHFRFGLGAGAGYGCFSKKLDVFLGFGLYYTF